MWSTRRTARRGGLRGSLSRGPGLLGRPSRGPGLLGRLSSRPGFTYLALRGGFALLARRVFGLRMCLVGRENLPTTGTGMYAGGWIAAGFPHRTWIDPFVAIALLSPEPRLAFLGDGRAITRSRVRRLVAARLGGIVPIWPGGRRQSVDAYVSAARSIRDAGAVFLLFPEIGPPVPVDRARPFGRGLGYFALRTGMPIVPLVLGGTHELFHGRRIVLRVLPPVSARELAGLPPDQPIPAPWTAEERIAARRIVTTLHERCATDVADAFRSVEPAPGTSKRWLRLTRMWE